MLDIQVDFAAGSMFDPTGKSGLAALTRGTLDLGAGKFDETAIAEQMADTGANLAGGADTDRASVALRTLSAKDKREPALEILKTYFTRRALIAPSSNAKNPHHCWAQGSDDPPRQHWWKGFLGGDVPKSSLRPAGHTREHCRAESR
jgi:hypothetical protein